MGQFDAFIDTISTISQIFLPLNSNSTCPFYAGFLYIRGLKTDLIIAYFPSQYLLIWSMFVAECVVRLSCLSDKIISPHILPQTGSVLGGVEGENEQ